MTKITLAALAFLVSMGCSRETRTSSDDVKRETTEAARTAADFTQEQAARARREAEARIADLDRRIEDLDDRASKASARAKADLQSSAKDLRVVSRRLKDRMSSWDDKAVEAWQTTRIEVEQAVTKAENGIDRLIDKARK